MWLLRKLFDDKRCTVGLLLVWMITVCTIFYCLGAFHMSYMHVGPGEDTVFMGLKIDSWGKWSALAIFSFMNTCINEFISNALGPWFVNSLQDHKTKSIEYSHATCLWIVQIHCMYVHVMGIFALFLFFSQVDFAIVRLLADWLVTGYSTVWFIQDKEVVPASSSRRRMGQQQDHDDTNEDEQRSMLPSGAKGELDDDDDIEMHIVPAAGDPRSSSAIITVYPRAFDKPEACFPHISSFSIGEEHEECNAAAASAATNNIDEYQKGPVTRSLISTGEDDEYEGDLVISSNGMHVGSIHAGSNDSGNRSRTSKKGRSSSVVRCFPPVTHTTPSEAAAASAKKNSKQGLKHGKKHRERLQDDNSESSECSDH